ncbi:uncharacterized protein METZ01_LOCUS411444, partial [marine metagenome]
GLVIIPIADIIDVIRGMSTLKFVRVGHIYGKTIMAIIIL